MVITIMLLLLTHLGGGADGEEDRGAGGGGVVGHEAVLAQQRRKAARGGRRERDAREGERPQRQAALHERVYAAPPTGARPQPVPRLHGTDGVKAHAWPPDRPTRSGRPVTNRACAAAPRGAAARHGSTRPPSRSAGMWGVCQHRMHARAANPPAMCCGMDGFALSRQDAGGGTCNRRALESFSMGGLRACMEVMHAMTESTPCQRGPSPRPGGS